LKNLSLHIVCHSIPFPADYGGAMDIFYKIKALYEKGVRIKLHCFVYDRDPQPELESYCEKVYYYKRKTGWRGFSLTKPYIVHSRLVPELLANLQQDNDPILFEGIHCTGFFKQLNSGGRKLMLRAHNVEAVYYKELAKTSPDLIKKFYYRFESILLKNYETKLPRDLDVFCVSESDSGKFREKYGYTHVSVLPVFIPCQDITAQEGVGSFCLYHGNLGVPENEMAATWLLKNVFTRIRVPFVVAGKNPSRRLVKLAHLTQHTCLVADPGEKEMNDLIGKAHINILPSFNKTGVKLKLMQALCKGKHCLVNDAAIEGSGLEDACHIGNTADAMASIVSQLYHLPFAEEELRLRRRLINTHFDNEINAELLIQHLR